MDRLRSCFTLVCIAAAMLPAGAASAAIITDGNYVGVRAELTAGNGAAGHSDIIVTHANLADSGPTAVANGAYSASGRALGTVIGGPRLKAKTTSTAPPVSGFFTPGSSTTARASWRDVLIPDAAGAPSTLDFNFSVHARLAVSQTVASGIAGKSNNSHARVRVQAANSVIGFLNGSTGLDGDVRNFNGGVTVTSSSTGWTTALFTPLGADEYDFSGSLTYTSPLLTFTPGTAPEAPFGAYFIGLALQVLTSNLGGTATADAFSTLSLDSITLPGGAALPAGVNLGFESGTALSSVPLPPAWLLLFSALLAGIVARSRAVSRRVPSSQG